MPAAVVIAVGEDFFSVRRELLCTARGHGR
jgi:hypothetical protein